MNATWSRPHEHPANAPRARSAPALLQVRDLHVHLRRDRRVIPVTYGVDLRLEAGRTLALVGESGSGKSVTAGAILGTLDTPPFSVARGRIELDGVDLLGLSQDARRQVRGERIAIVFQDALDALNPAFSVGWQIAESLRCRRGLGRSDARRRAVELMEAVRIPEARARFDDHPYQFSGGMRQRVMIAMALSLDPDVLIADEPTTALDVTVQARILELLAEIQRERGMALLLITHDVGVAASIADRVAIMYAGRIVEEGAAQRVLGRPAHPYTRDLLAAVPRADRRLDSLSAIEGQPPELGAMPTGCPYSPRCTVARPECFASSPPLRLLPDDQASACFVDREEWNG